MRDILKVVIIGGAFLTLLLPLYVSDSMFFPYITGKNFAFRIIVEIMLGAWVILAFLDARYRPRFSWVLASGATLLLIMLFANTFGEYPPKSFWSNFERMDGYVTLVHFYLYFFVLACTFHTQRLWKYFKMTAVGVAIIVAGIGLSNYLGGGPERIDATLGNSTYMAIYMLFNLALVGLLMLQNRTWPWLLGGSLVSVLFLFDLLQTGTRGTFIGLAVGLVVSVCYLAIFAVRTPGVRKVAIGSLVALVLIAGGAFAVKDTDFVQNNQALARYANIDLSSDLTVRETIWGMAWQGVKERPILGWGQGSFNYVFNKYYDPFLYGQEQWFDRVHDIVLDWLIAGGVLGFAAYLSIFLALAYYLFWRPLRRPEESEFSVAERALLIGLIVAYCVHNLVVFDNLVSYMFFAIILAYVHQRVATSIPKLEAMSVSREVVEKVVAPTAIVATCLIVYFVNVPGIQASRDIIDGLRTQDIAVRLDALDRAYQRGSFADQEIVEQYMQQAPAIVQATSMSQTEKVTYLKRADELINEMLAKKPGDARLELFASGYYKRIGDLEKAKQHIDSAHSLSPDKQSIILEQGSIAAAQGDYEAAHEYLKEAYELDTSFVLPRVIYAASFLYFDQTQKMYDLIGDDFDAFAKNSFTLQIAYETKHYAVVERILEHRIALEPTVLQNYTNLAGVYYEQQDTKQAVQVLEEAKVAVPAFATTAECVIGNLKAGKKPEDGC